MLLPVQHSSWISDAGFLGFRLQVAQEVIICRAPKIIVILGGFLYTLLIKYNEFKDVANGTAISSLGRYLC